MRSVTIALLAGGLSLAPTRLASAGDANDFADGGVRKQPTRQPGNSLGGGNDGGTPMRRDLSPWRPITSQIASALTASAVAIDSPSYVLSFLLRKP